MDHQHVGDQEGELQALLPVQARVARRLVAVADVEKTQTKEVVVEEPKSKKEKAIKKDKESIDVKKTK